MRISVRSGGGDRLVVGIRGHQVVVAQPHEVDGSDAGPTALELFVGAYAACVAQYAEIFLRRHGGVPDDFHVDCSFAVGGDLPPRIETIDLEVSVPPGFQEAWVQPLHRVLDHCVVQNSLQQPPSVRIHVLEPETA